MDWSESSLYQFHVVIVWFAVALKLTTSLVFIVIAVDRLLVLLLPQEVMLGAGPGAVTVTFHLILLLVPFAFVALTSIW